MRFSSSGAFKSLLHTGAGGAAQGQFVRPESLAVDADSNVYIGDSFANKVIVFDDQGDFVREWPATRPTGVTVVGERVYVLTNGLLTVFNRQGQNLGSFGRRAAPAARSTRTKVSPQTTRGYTSRTPSTSGSRRSTRRVQSSGSVPISSPPIS